MARRKKDEAPGVNGRPLELPGPLGDLARAMGGRAVLSEKLEKDAKTIWRWAQDGRVGNVSVRRELEKMFHDHGVTEGVEAFLSGSRPKPRGGIHARLKLGADRKVD